MGLAQKLKLGANPVFLMDGTAFIYRSFYANRHLRRADGFPTNALVLVTRVLLKILREEQPEFFLFTMDGRGKNFRNDIYDKYKANREAMPEELAVQMEPVARMVNALGLRREVANGFEADDCIASLAARFSRERPVVIVSGDKDLKQCLGPCVYMWDPGSKEDKLVTEKDFEEENGVIPALWPDVQALVGDSSDNIPGVPGIGPKTARQIFEICPGLEEIRNHFALLPPKLQAKLEAHLEEMFKWRELTTLRLDVCSNLTLADLKVGEIDLKQCGELADEFELLSVKREITQLAQKRQAVSIALESNDSQLTSQDSLIDTNDNLEDMPWPLGVEAKSIDALEACKGKIVSFVRPEGSSGAICVAVASISSDENNDEPTEYIWKGSMADLCQWLGKAQTIVVPDLKSMLVASPSWRELFFKGKHPECFDLGLASYLLNPEDGDYSWKRLVSRWREHLDCKGTGAAAFAIAMAQALQKNLRANALHELYVNMELPLIPVLAKMEIRGVAIDPEAFRRFLNDVQVEIDLLTEKVFAAAGEKFNIRSSRQLGELLFNKLHLAQTRKTKSGQASTSQASLEKLASSSPVVDNILQFRKLEKMRSTYLDPFPRLMDSKNRIHTTFNQEATATGRLSSSNPNLQNIPVRGPLGLRMRACFVASAGNLLISADYSQIELRILAHLSQDATLIEAFGNGEDIHTRTASLIFDTASDEVLPDQRRMAKTINFGLLYGMGAQKLAQELKIGTGEARDFIDRYFSRLKGLKIFYEKILADAREFGYVTTMAGRKRWLPEIYSSNGQTAAQAQRQAVNTVIQGSAADVIKLAMLQVATDEFLMECGARLVLQVHDELLLETPDQFADKAGARVSELMENVQPGGKKFSVPLLVDWCAGSNWGQAH